MKPVEGELLRTIFRNSFWSTFACVAGPVVTFLFGGLTIRYVGIEAAGFSAAVGAILGMAGQFAGLGIGDAVVPALGAAIGAGDRPKVSRLVGVIVCTALVSGCVIGAAVVAFAGPIVAWTRTGVPADVALRFIAISAVSTIAGSLTGAMLAILRSASRHDLVTKTALPLSIVSGAIGCLLVPVFPSLLTVALIGCCASLLNLPIFFALARKVVPETARPAFSWAELPSLLRYGSWMSLTRLVSAMTGGVDDLAVTAFCGAAALPPWSICKKLWLTVHTFLAQHVEHLIPTLGGMRERSRQLFDRVNSGMHWYVAIIAASGYTCIAWCGPAVIAMVAGEGVAALCTLPIFAFSLVGIFWSLNIIPVISAMAQSDARPGFVLAVCVNSVQLAAVVLLARTRGVPAVYLAPLVAIPPLVATLGTSGTRLLDPALAWRRIRPVLIPSAFGLTGIVSSLAAPAAWPLSQRAVVGAVVATAVLILTLATEHGCGINAQEHRQLVRIVRHAVGLVDGIRRSFPAISSRGAEP